MSDHESGRPSKALTRLYGKLLAALPDVEDKKLVALEPTIAQTTTLGDFHRCFRCAEWAINLTTRSGHSHLRHLLRGITTWKEGVGILLPGRTVSDVELDWLDQAVDAATAVAQSSSWASVPWEALLAQPIALDGLPPSGEPTQAMQAPEEWASLVRSVPPTAAAVYASVLTEEGITVTQRPDPRTSRWLGAQYPEELLVPAKEFEQAHNILVEWSRAKPAMSDDTGQ